NSAPQLEKIFAAEAPASPGGPMRVSFIRDPQRRSNRAIWDLLAKAGDGDVPKLTFFERVCFMIDESSNAATHAVQEDLGFLYINSVLWQSGLYDPARGGGMWSGRFFLSGNVFAPAPVPTPTPRTPDGAEIWSASTPRAAAAFMAL